MSPAARILAAAMLALAVGCSAQGAGQPAAATVLPQRAVESGARTGGMLRLVLRLTDHGVDLVSSSEAPDTMNRRDPLAGSPTFCRALSADGTVLAERGFRLETTIRSEAPGKDGTIEGARADVAEPVFTVTVPMVAGLASVRFYRARPGADRASAEVLGEVRP
jgi:hypothetical protein